jgi:hypothetical protein
MNCKSGCHLAYAYFLYFTVVPLYCCTVSIVLLALIILYVHTYI